MRTRSFLVCAGIVVLLLGFAFQARNEHEAAAFYEDALRLEDVYETVTVGEHEFRVHRGAVLGPEGDRILGSASYEPLRLAYSKSAMRRNPLLALPGTNPDSLRRAIERLDTLQRDIASLQSSERERLAIASLYPIAFLRAMANAEEKRLAFLERGTRQALAEALRAERSALNEYRTALANHERAFRSVVPESEKRFAAGQASFSYATILDTTEKLAGAGETTAEALRARTRCFGGAVALCGEGDLMRPEVWSEEASGRDLSLAQARQVVRAMRLSGRVSLARITRTYAIPQSECVGEFDDKLYKVTTVVPPISAIPYDRVAYVGDLPFIDSTAYTDVPFYEFLKTRGVRYVPTDPLLHYVCIDFWRDMAPVYALSAISTFASSTPLSAHLAENESLLARAVERDLLTIEEPVYEDTAHAYASLLREYAARPDAAESYRDSIENLLTNVRFNALKVDEAIKNIVEKEEANMRILKEGVPVDLAAGYAFFFRSALPFMFMASNPSVVGGGGVETTKLPAPTRDPYVYFSKLATTEEATERIIRDMRIYRDLHSENFSDIEQAFIEP